MGNTNSIAKALDDFPSIGKGAGEIDLGLGEIGLGLGEVGLGAAGAGIAVGVADGTAKSGYDWLRGKGDNNLGTEDRNNFGDWGSNIPVAGAGRGGGIIDIHDLIPDSKYPESDDDFDDPSKAFSDAGDESEQAQNEQTDEIRDQETKGVEEDDSEDDSDPKDEEDDSDPKDKPKDPPGPIINPDKEPEEKVPPNSPVVNPKPFRSVPAGESLLRAMKRLSSQDVGPDDFETEQESKEDHQTLLDIQQEMGSETKNEQHQSILDRHIRFRQPLFMPRDYKDYTPSGAPTPTTIPKFEVIPNDMIYGRYTPLGAPTPLGEPEQHTYADTQDYYKTMEFKREILI